MMTSLMVWGDGDGVSWGVVVVMIVVDGGGRIWGIFDRRFWS